MAGSRRAEGRRAPWGAVLALALIAVAGLPGCSSLPSYANPIDWYRGVTGASKNDDKGAERNAQNLAAGSEEPYPNLATVPPPPDTAMSSIDREKMQKGLVADRAHALYSNEALRSGHEVPPLPGEAPAAGVVQPLPPPPASAASPGLGASNPAPAQPPAVASAAPPPAPAATAQPAKPGRRHAPPARGSEAPPQESSLQSPQIKDLPVGETPRAPPPAPRGVAPTQEAEVHVPVPPVPPPVFAPIQPAPEPRIMQSPEGRKEPSVSLAAAEIRFGDSGSALSAADRKQLADVAKLYKENGGTVRIVGYGRRGYGRDAAQAELSSFSRAIDHAKAVAEELGRLGVPSQHIIVQAAPDTDSGGLQQERAEVLLEY